MTIKAGDIVRTSQGIGIIHIPSGLDGKWQLQYYTYGKTRGVDSIIGSDSTMASGFNIDHTQGFKVLGNIYNVLDRLEEK